MKNLDKILKALEKRLAGKAIQDYSNRDSTALPVRQVLDDKAFRDQVRKEKAAVLKKVDEEPELEQKSLTDKIVDKVAGPEPEKPLTALQKRLGTAR